MQNLIQQWGEPVLNETIYLELTVGRLKGGAEKKAVNIQLRYLYMTAILHDDQFKDSFHARCSH
jgi:hypothetical protein